MPGRIFLLVSALILAVAAPAAEVRVMPLGDSLTATVRDQPVLRQRLTAAGIRCVLVGSQTTGSERHEGDAYRAIAFVTSTLDCSMPC